MLCDGMAKCYLLSIVYTKSHKKSIHGVKRGKKAGKQAYMRCFCESRGVMHNNREGLGVRD
jgi:hypothetical protein